jgi:hypothetical protein
MEKEAGSVTYEPLSSLDHSKDERDGHRILWLERELAEAERVIALCAADTTAADLRQEVEFLMAEKKHVQQLLDFTEEALRERNARLDRIERLAKGEAV